MPAAVATLIGFFAGKAFRKKQPPVPCVTPPYSFTVTVPSSIVDLIPPDAIDALKSLDPRTLLLVAIALFLFYLLYHPSVPKVKVELEEDELADVLRRRPQQKCRRQRSCCRASTRRPAGTSARRARSPRRR